MIDSAYFREDITESSPWGYKSVVAQSQMLWQNFRVVMFALPREICGFLVWTCGIVPQVKPAGDCTTALLSNICTHVHGTTNEKNKRCDSFLLLHTTGCLRILYDFYYVVYKKISNCTFTYAMLFSSNSIILFTNYCYVHKILTKDNKYFN